MGIGLDILKEVVMFNRATVWMMLASSAMAAMGSKPLYPANNSCVQRYHCDMHKTRAHKTKRQEEAYLCKGLREAQLLDVFDLLCIPRREEDLCRGLGDDLEGLICLLAVVC